MTDPAPGPFETERDAATAVRHITSRPPGAGEWAAGNQWLLERACEIAGVELGEYDHRILLWIGGWEPWVCAVIAGLIIRASQAAREPPGARAEQR